MHRALVVFVVVLAALSSGCMKTEKEEGDPGQEERSPVSEQQDAGNVALATEIAEGVHLLRGRFVEGSQPDGNSVILEGSEGLIVVDTGRHRNHTRQILEVASQIGMPIRAIVNTHWHLDHTGGNILLRDEIPEITIHGTSAIEGATEGFLANYGNQIEEYLPTVEDQNAHAILEAELVLVRAAERLAPTNVVESSEATSIAGRPLELHIERDAVTAADLWITDPATGVVIAGDLVTLPVPLLDTAQLDGWIEALENISSQNPRIVIPGHGRVLDGSELEQYASALENLAGCGESERSDEECADGWIENIRGLIPPEEEAFARSLLAFYIPRHIRR